MPCLGVVPLEVLAGAGKVDALHADVDAGRGQGAGRARQRLRGHPSAGRGRRAHLWFGQERITRWRQLSNISDILLVDTILIQRTSVQ